MDKGGWIKVYRKIEDCPIWFDDKYDHGHAWIDLLLMANHRTKTIIFDGKEMNIQAGQILTSVRKLSTKWGWCKDTTLKFLRLLEDQKMIEKDSNSKRTLITIVNYGIYQGSTDTKTDTESHTESDTESPQTRSKEIKNINICPTDSDDRNQDIEDFEKIYQWYGKKNNGKSKARKTYLGWTSQKGRYVADLKKYIHLDKHQISHGVLAYMEHQKANDTDQAYWKNIDTIMNQILDWIPDEYKPGVYKPKGE